MDEDNSRASQLGRLLKLSRVIGVCRVCTLCFAVKGLLLAYRTTLSPAVVVMYFVWIEIFPTAYMLHAFNSSDEESVRGSTKPLSTNRSRDSLACVPDLASTREAYLYPWRKLQDSLSARMNNYSGSLNRDSTRGLAASSGHRGVGDSKASIFPSEVGRNSSSNSSSSDSVAWDESELILSSKKGKSGQAKTSGKGSRSSTSKLAGRCSRLGGDYDEDFEYGLDMLETTSLLGAQHSPGAAGSGGSGTGAGTGTGTVNLRGLDMESLVAADDNTQFYDL